MSHPRPFYYLENFATALSWLRERYGDLLSDADLSFMEGFQKLTRQTGGLLVRMIGRKGDLFRTSKLLYPEIGCPYRAAAGLMELGWVDSRPLLTKIELAAVLRKSELQQALRLSGEARRARKSELPALSGIDPAECRALADWWPEAPDATYRLVIKPLCERLRRLFFGNFRQEWSEFVLADLDIFRYEKVGLDAAARAFQTRAHIETFDELYSCRQRLEEGADIAAILQCFPAPVTDNEWLEGKRRKLQFQLARCCERQRNLPQALEVYRDCLYAGSRVRMVRVLELLERVNDALQLAARIREEAADEIESQLIGRMMPRLQRKAGLMPAKRRGSPGWSTFQLLLPTTQRPVQLEQATGEVLSRTDAPVYYVENGLLNSLFGLLCWEAIFAPVPGAFFHPFQAAPADLDARDFHGRRASAFAACLGQLDSDAYQHTIWRNFELKSGIQSPFVYWGLLTQPLLSLALACVPGSHLRVCFQRILANIHANRSGLPDLVQLWPRERRYRLIEVKGPGDRLQDNQIRWLSFCVAHEIPVAVCHVGWNGAPA
jgi:VRR-NUC domain